MDIKEKLKEMLREIPTLKEGFDRHDKILKETVDVLDKFYEDYEETKDAVENDLMDLIKQLIDKVNDLESKIDGLTRQEISEQPEETMEEQVQEDREEKEEQSEEENEEEPQKFEEQGDDEKEEESSEEKKDEEEEKPLPEPPVSSENVKPVVSDFKEYISREEIAKDVFKNFIK